MYYEDDKAYNGISQQVDIRSTRGHKEKVYKKEKKEEVEYNTAIFKIKGNFNRNKFTQILIGVNKLNI